MTDRQTGLPSIDKPWLKYYSQEAINATIPECTIYQNIWEHNKEHLDDIALEYYGFQITFDRMFAEIQRCAKALRQAGVKRGDRVNLCTAGVPEAVYIVLACSMTGAIANFINPMFTTEQVVERINDTEANLLVVLDKLHPYIADAIDKICVKRVVIIPATGSLPALARCIASIKNKSDKTLTTAMENNAKYVRWRDFIRAGESFTGVVEEAYIKDTPAVMVYSSGTTGASKGIQLTNDGINATIIQYKYMTTELSRQMSFLHICPVWFSTGISICLLMPLCLGMRIILEPVFSCETFAADLANYKPNFIVGATSLWLYSMEYKPLEKMDLSFLKYPVTGGEQLLPRTEEQINAFLKEHNCSNRLANGWGMCELGATATNTATTAIAHNPELQRPGTVGIPIPFATVSAFSPDTDEELTYGQVGELRVLSPCRMLEYYKNPEETEKFFYIGKDGQAWGCTGDMGYVDKDGFVFVLGRASDCYTDPNGNCHYLFDAENVILQDREIALCEVIDITVDGQSIPVAHMVLNSTCGEEEKDVISRVDKLCREQLEEYAVPRAYKVRTSFDVKPSGKRDTEVLRKEREGYVDAYGKDWISIH